MYANSISADSSNASLSTVKGYSSSRYLLDVGGWVLTALFSLFNSLYRLRNFLIVSLSIKDGEGID